jgi:hypothetical protein
MEDMPMTPAIDRPTPQARRRARTEARLREALRDLANDPGAQPTVAALARAGRVGRNIIYTHHAPVLAALRELQAQRVVATKATAALRELQAQRVVATKATAVDRDRTRSALREAESRITAMATQNAGLLKRAVEAEERAERLERRNAQLVQELDRIRRPVPIRPSAGRHDPSAA